MARSHIAKRSIVLSGRKTSVSLEEAFWSVLKDAAAKSGRSLGALVAEINVTRSEEANLSSCLRLFALDHVQTEGRG